MSQKNFFTLINNLFFSILIMQSNAIFLSASGEPDSPFFKPPTPINVRASGFAVPTASLNRIDPRDTGNLVRPEAQLAQRSARMQTVSPRTRFPFPEGDFQPNDQLAQRYRTKFKDDLSAAEAIELEAIFPDLTVFPSQPTLDNDDNMTPSESLQVLRSTTHDHQGRQNLRRRGAIADDNDDNIIPATAQPPSAQRSPAQVAMVPLLRHRPQHPLPRAQLVAQDPLLTVLQQRQQSLPAATTQDPRPPIPTLRPSNPYHTPRHGIVIEQHHNTRPPIPTLRTTQADDDLLSDFNDTDDSGTDSEFTVEEEVFRLQPIHRTNTVPFGEALLEHRAQPAAAAAAAFEESLQLPTISIAPQQRRGAISMATTPPQARRHIRTPRPEDHGQTAREVRQQFQEHLLRARHHNELPSLDHMTGHTRGKAPDRK